MDRREFMRLAGSAAGAAACYTFMPHVAFAGDGSGHVISTSTIERPCFAAPEIVRIGDAIPYVKSATAKTNVGSAWLGTPEGGAPIELSLETTDAARDSITAFLPATQPDPGVYDLYIHAVKGNKERVERLPRAVCFVDNFKTDFQIGLISDVHIGDPRLTSDVPGFNVVKTFIKEINILNERKVEFCLCCGDLSWLPPRTKKEIAQYMDLLTSHARFPVFTVPGNHDGYATGTLKKISFDTYKHWRRSYGPFNFEASYGNVSIIGINTFDGTPLTRNLYGGYGEALDMGAMGQPQLEWLDGALARATAQRDGASIMIGHHNPTNTTFDRNGPFTVLPFSETGRHELLGLIKKHSPDYFFVG
ncbi:MAG: metallophosphoesterase, partial [Victivallales bacterium]|nr:metallophosphoesterase [Victivallales bacterium]